MKHFRYILILLFAFSLQSCLGSFYDIEFHKDTDIVIPADGGTYHFEVEAVETKTSFSSVLRRFEYRIIIDGEVIDQQLVHIRISNAHIEVGDQWEIEFNVPQNETLTQREVRVEVIVEKDYRPNESRDSNKIDPGNNSWQTVWEAIQLSH